jgi:segregation and condensation protein A
VAEEGLLARPPLNILIDPSLAKRKSPWEIDLSELLDLFLRTIMQSEIIDLRAAGTAALSSATIYRLKVESLFLFERLQRERRFVDASEPPLLVVMPFRYELYSTSIDELFEALGRILEDIMRSQPGSNLPTSVLDEVVPPGFDNYILSLQSLLIAFKRVLSERLEGIGRIQLSELLRGLKPLEAARVFILLLFAAQNGEVILEQEDDDVLVVSVGQLE